MSIETTCFMKNGLTYKVTSRGDLDLHDKLPAGNYVVTLDPFEQFQLSKVEDFNSIKKLYGNTTRHATRIINTFEDRPNTTGVMLTGEKGSGKTLLAREISIKAAERGYPTIVINSPWRGDKFNKFMQMITQPCVILFDEFEKVYSRDDQECILTLLDGVFASKKLFLLTCNDKWRVDTNMRNRPGRIFYMIDFTGLDEAFIREYCDDNLINKSYIDSVCNMAMMFDQFNFDMLKAVIEDMNRYNESPSQVMELLNTKPEFSNNQKFNVKMVKDGVVIDPDNYEYLTWEGNPLSQRNVAFDYKDVSEDSDEDWHSMFFTQENIKQLDPKQGLYVYQNDKGDRVELTRHKTLAFDYTHLV